MSAQSPECLPRRRNGRHRACEPCRKRKLACDHAVPVCQRCKRRKITPTCVYLDAPMTKRPSVDELPGLSAPPMFNSSSPVLGHLTVGPNSRGPLPGSLPSSASSSGFLGPTSYSAVFLENENNIDLVLNTELSAKASGSSVQIREIEGFESVAMAHLQLVGANILKQLPNQETCHVLIEKNRQLNDGWLKHGTKHCAQSLWSTFGKYLSKSKSTRELEPISQVLWRNALTALEEPEEPTAWLDSFSGCNIRWEALGVLFASWCWGAMASPESDAIFEAQESRWKDKVYFVRQMKECASLCAILCGHTDLVNPIVINLLYNNCLLQSILGAGGDTSLVLWRRHGDLCSATTALGLHKELDSGECKYTIKSQMRKRLYSSVFCIDKTLASFTGRPPFLSRRYSSCLLPLDISDEVLLQGKEEITKAASKLDQYGWNTENMYYRSTALRTNLYQSLIRDEILELSLGSPSEQAATSTMELRQYAEKNYSEHPPVARYSKDDLSNLAVSNVDMWSKIGCRLKHLQNLFLIERLAFKFKQTDGQALLDIARETVSLILVIWTQRDRFFMYSYHFEWMIMSYGVPSSGVLCIELLKQTRDPGTYHLILPRSETIQNLSVFIGFLGWVRPTAGNYEVCCRMKGIITRILDQILEAPPTTTQVGNSSVAAAAIQQPLLDFELPLDFLDFEGLGGGSELWGEAPWMNMGTGIGTGMS